MSSAPALAKKHALGLPAGSVRAVHVLAIVALICAMILFSRQGRIVAMPPYLIYLLLLMVGHYFAAHGVSVAPPDESTPSPLYLPGWLVRLLIMIPLIGCIGWKFYSDEAGLREQMAKSVIDFGQQPWLPLVILAGFFAGHIVGLILGQHRQSIAVQSFEAWISLIALIMIVLASIVHLIIDPGWEERLYLPTWESFVGGVVAFYFGERT